MPEIVTVVPGTTGLTRLIGGEPVETLKTADPGE